MAQNFVACDRDQELLLPPSVHDWLPEGHLAFVIEAVSQLDPSVFYSAFAPTHTTIAGFVSATRPRWPHCSATCLRSAPSRGWSASG